MLWKLISFYAKHIYKTQKAVQKYKQKQANPIKTLMKHENFASFQRLCLILYGKINTVKNKINVLYTNTF